MTNSRKKNYNNPVSATLTGIADLFRKHEAAGKLNVSDRLDGKTVLVDGSSSGLGFAVAVDVARRGARVIMACRSGIPSQGEKVKKLSGNQDVHMFHVDFADIHSIRELVTSLKSSSLFVDGKGIDILVCNAGIVPKKSRKTPQGLEEMFMVNYFSKFIFVNLLLENNCFQDQTSIIPYPASRIPHPASRIPYPASRIPHPTSRIIFVASESHRNPKKIDWNDFGKYREYQIGKSIELYGYYKLLLTTFACELSRRLNSGDETTLSVFALCPGPVNSNIAREAPKIFQPLLRVVFGIFFKSPAKAAVPVVYLAASPDLEGKSFDYLFLMSRSEVDEKASDPENGERLWQLSEELRKSLEAV
jgi:NAD(P)-dependent dehydrogenase (short-subunit alcohol dehydrogenase family)